MVMVGVVVVVLESMLVRVVVGVGVIHHLNGAEIVFDVRVVAGEIVVVTMTGAVGEAVAVDVQLRPSAQSLTRYRASKSRHSNVKRYWSRCWRKPPSLAPDAY
jgi:hypothetical protein